MCIRAALTMLLLTLAPLALPACGGHVDYAALPPAALDGCEPPTADLLNPEAVMLPGRECMYCHKEGGQASRYVWTAAGTVFNNEAATQCNSAGVAGAEVKIADETGLVLITLTTNATGNFFTAEPLTFKELQVQVSLNGQVQRMTSFATGGLGANCPACHMPSGIAPGRVYLN